MSEEEENKDPTGLEIAIGILILIGMVVPLVDWFQHPEFSQDIIFQRWKWVIIGTFVLAIWMKLKGYAN